MQSVLRAEGAAPQHLMVQLERIADALERLAVRRRQDTGGLVASTIAEAVAGGGGGLSSRWAFRNRGIRAALERAAARHATGVVPA
jgi:hypothetical protein